MVQVRLRLSLAVFVLGASIALWPVPRVDLSPIQHKVPGTSIGTAWSSTVASDPKVHR